MWNFLQQRFDNATKLTCIDFIIFNVVATTIAPIMENILDKYHVQIQICDPSMAYFYCWALFYKYWDVEANYCLNIGGLMVNHFHRCWMPNQASVTIEECTIVWGKYKFINKIFQFYFLESSNSYTLLILRSQMDHEKWRWKLNVNIYLQGINL